MSSPEDGRPVDLDVERVQRRILTVVVASQVLRGAGLAAVATVGALIAEQLLAGPGAGRLQAALFTVGSAYTPTPSSGSRRASGRA